MGALSYGLPPKLISNTPRMLSLLLTYSGGRVLSYTLAGALMGALGAELVSLLGAGQGHQWLQWSASIFMVLIGIHIAGWLPRLSVVERLGVPLWQKLEPLAGRLLPVDRLHRALGYGLIWGWLPCGLVYTMLLSTAVREGSLSGALYMFSFGLGTLPALTATGFLAGRLYRLAHIGSVRVAVGITIVALGILTLWFPGYLLQEPGPGNLDGMLH